MDPETLLLLFLLPSSVFCQLLMLHVFIVLHGTVTYQESLLSINQSDIRKHVYCVNCQDCRIYYLQTLLLCSCHTHVWIGYQIWCGVMTPECYRQANDSWETFDTSCCHVAIHFPHSNYADSTKLTLNAQCCADEAGKQSDWSFLLHYCLSSSASQHPKVLGADLEVPESVALAPPLHLKKKHVVDCLGLMALGYAALSDLSSWLQILGCSQWTAPSSAPHFHCWTLGSVAQLKLMVFLFCYLGHLHQVPVLHGLLCQTFAKEA